MVPVVRAIALAGRTPAGGSRKVSGSRATIETAGADGERPQLRPDNLFRSPGDRRRRAVKSRRLSRAPIKAGRSEACIYGTAGRFRTGDGSPRVSSAHRPIPWPVGRWQRLLLYTAPLTRPSLVSREVREGFN